MIVINGMMLGVLLLACVLCTTSLAQSLLGGTIMISFSADATHLTTTLTVSGGYAGSFGVSTGGMVGPAVSCYVPPSTASGAVCTDLDANYGVTKAMQVSSIASASTSSSSTTVTVTTPLSRLGLTPGSTASMMFAFQGWDSSQNIPFQHASSNCVIQSIAIPAASSAVTTTTTTTTTTATPAPTTTTTTTPPTTTTTTAAPTTTTTTAAPTTTTTAAPTTTTTTAVPITSTSTTATATATSATTTTAAPISTTFATSTTPVATTPASTYLDPTITTKSVSPVTTTIVMTTAHPPSTTVEIPETTTTTPPPTSSQPTTITPTTQTTTTTVATTTTTPATATATTTPTPSTTVLESTSTTPTASTTTDAASTLVSTLPTSTSSPPTTSGSTTQTFGPQSTSQSTVSTSLPSNGEDTPTLSIFLSVASGDLMIQLSYNSTTLWGMMAVANGYSGTFGVVSSQGMTGSMISCYGGNGGNIRPTCIDLDGHNYFVAPAQRQVTNFDSASLNSSHAMMYFSVPKSRFPFLSESCLISYCFSPFDASAQLPVQHSGSDGTDHGCLSVNFVSGAVSTVTTPFTARSKAYVIVGVVLGVSLLAATVAVRCCGLQLSLSTTLAVQLCTVLLLWGMVAVVVVFANTDFESEELPIFRAFGEATAFVLSVIMIPTTKHVGLGVIVGSSYERMLFLHPVLGFTVLVTMTVHMGGMFTTYDDPGDLFQDTSSLYGFIAWIFLLCVTLPAMFIRRKSYNFFRFTHCLFILVLVFGVLHHDELLVMLVPGFALWVIDLIMRLYSATSSKARVVELTYNKQADIVTLQLSVDCTKARFLRIPSHSIPQPHFPSLHHCSVANNRRE
ncbi:Hypothetical protein, putative [Bodo saltans]|uniref:Ferric oxidoreductase domain-containing protein n=1 Tax=Bodo saltans TaxID=75058 RepID=A0A0S4IM18_BODSA|nr:Hypothetical protein, putative [Bodo saltans]|eukprot:CUE72420.1 Hypothetical protein, putative [Bodo saltans]